MKIREYNETLNEKMSEFDMWVTPSLGDLRDAKQFRENLAKLKEGFNYLSEITDDFSYLQTCAASSLATNTLDFMADKDEATAETIFNSICNFLLLATGKTDNNLKCQFTIMLRNQLDISTYPVKNSDGQWIDQPLPRTLMSTDVSKLMVQFKDQKEYLQVFTEAYFHLIISDEGYAKQLWSLGNAYVSQREKGEADSFLSPLVIFQSRGSITSKTGHMPEDILRQYMTEWGLHAGTDFNELDVELGDIIDDEEVQSNEKKRKYDFIIPFKSRTKGPKIFIQSQFYAGDSGSVSHKVVDQTDRAREVTKQKYPDAVFIEYLDGAGYFSKLNGDLRRMLAKPLTKDFIQIRTAPIKLRRELQEIQFLTVLEIEHAIIRTDGRKDNVIDILRQENYSEEEIERVISDALKDGSIKAVNDNQYALNPERIETVRRYCYLDIIADYGGPVSVDNTAGCLFVAGLGNCWGMPQNEVMRKATEVFPGLSVLLTGVQDAFDDIQWLIEKGFVISK